MSACIYHDAVAVTICPGCDFAVCQQCIDAGENGLCEECSASQAQRAKMAEIAAEVPRCKYCRIAADEETPIDGHGYCPACQALARCVSHEDLIAFGNCKSCRKQYCRKCLGFNDICESCTAKQRANPPKPKAVSPTAPIGPGKPKAGAKGPAPVASKGGAKGKRPQSQEPAKAKKGAPESKKGAAETKRLAPEPKKAAPEGKKSSPEWKGPAKGKAGKPGAGKGGGEAAKRPASRGTAMMEAKLQEKAGPQNKKTLVILAATAVLIIGVLLFAITRPPSDEQIRAQVQPQMLAVHRAVMVYFRTHGKLPPSEAALVNQLAASNAPAVQDIKLKFGAAPDGPGQVVYSKRGKGFIVQASGSDGSWLLGDGGKPLAMDQFYDSGR